MLTSRDVRSIVHDNERRLSSQSSNTGGVAPPPDSSNAPERPVGRKRQNLANSNAASNASLAGSVKEIVEMIKENIVLAKPNPAVDLETLKAKKVAAMIVLSNTSSTLQMIRLSSDYVTEALGGSNESDDTNK